MSAGLFRWLHTDDSSHRGLLMDTCIIAAEVEQELMVTFVWVTRPKRP